MDTGGREREDKRADGRFEVRLLVLGAMLECPACTWWNWKRGLERVGREISNPS